VFTFALKGGYDAGGQSGIEPKAVLSISPMSADKPARLVIHPASTTHSQLDDAAKIKSGAAPDVVRLSIGIEDKEDLIADLEQALERLSWRRIISGVSGRRKSGRFSPG